MTPEEQRLLRDVANSIARCKRDVLDMVWNIDRLKAAALAYARPLIVEECARIAEEHYPSDARIVACAIREHGKEKKHD